MGDEVTVVRPGILPPWASVRTRRVEPELMDRQDLDPELRRQALAGLGRINLLSLTSRHVWRPIAAYAREAARPIRVLDVASGGGDVAFDLARFARRAALPITVDGCDLNPEAVEQCNRRARGVEGGPRFFVHDVLAGPLPRGYDVITSTLFLHHFEDDLAMRVLGAFRAAGPSLVVISDLARSTPGFLLAHLACQCLTRSYVVHYDGPRSVAGAFTAAEFSALAGRAGLVGHRIRATWPFRFLVTWRAPQ